jgi:hypothetical protein
MEVAMNMPERNVALTWVGRTVVDRDGAEIGACTAVFADDATELAEWVCSEFDGTTVFIPAVGAAESDGMVQVVISREDVAGAPSVGGPEHISGDEEAALYEHYGIPHSRDASPTVLPTEDAILPVDRLDGVPRSANGFESVDGFESADVAGSGGEPESVDGSESVDEFESTTAPDSTAASASATPSDSAAAPTTDAVLRSARGGREDAVSQPAPSARRRVMLAVAGAAALVATATAVLGARRRRKVPPPTPLQRLALHGRAASAAVTARTGRIATPVLETTTQVVRQRKAGAAAATAATAAAVLAAKRRRSEDVRNQWPRETTDD